MGFGTYSAVVNLAGTAYGLIRFGVDAAILVYSARGRQDAEAGRLTSDVLGAGLVVLAGSGIVAAFAMSFAAEWLAVSLFGEPSLSGPLRFAGILTALQCLTQFSYAALAGFQKFAEYARVMTWNALFALALTSVGMWLFGVAGALVGYGVGQFVLMMTLGIETVYAAREQGIRVTHSRFGVALRTLVRLGIPFYMSGVVAVPVTLYLQGLLSRSVGVDALGYLRVIGTVTAVVAFLPGSVAAVTTSMLTRVRVEESRRSSNIFEYTLFNLKVVLFCTTFLAIVLAALTPFVIEILFGKHYSPAIEPGRIALMSTALSCTAGAAAGLFFALERSDVLFWQSLVQFAAVALTGIYLIPAAGVLGYVGAELVGSVVAIVVAIFAISQMSEWNWRRNRVAESFAVCSASALVSMKTIFLLSESYFLAPAMALVLLLMSLAMWRFGLSAWELSVLSRLTPGLRWAR